MSEPRINPENGYFYTGVTATAAEASSMRGAFATPLIVVGSYLPISPQEVIHAYALKYGLPEIRGYYGIDFRTNEFIREADADQGEPDKWPSRKLDDVLAAQTNERTDPR